MNLLLRLRGHLPREIIPEVFFRIHPPSEDDFLDACRDGKSLLVERWLFYSLVDVSVCFDLPLRIAADAGHLSIVSLLIDRGSNPDIALVNAASNGDYEIVTLLLKHGARLPHSRKIFSISRTMRDFIESYLLKNKQ